MYKLIVLNYLGKDQLVGIFDLCSDSDLFILFGDWKRIRIVDFFRAQPGWKFELDLEEQRERGIRINGLEKILSAERNISLAMTKYFNALQILHVEDLIYLNETELKELLHMLEDDVFVKSFIVMPNVVKDYVVPYMGEQLKGKIAEKLSGPVDIGVIENAEIKLLKAMKEIRSKGEDDNTKQMKELGKFSDYIRELFLSAGIFMFMIALLYLGSLFYAHEFNLYFMSIDNCLDRGGCWDYKTNQCQQDSNGPIKKCKKNN